MKHPVVTNLLLLLVIACESQENYAVDFAQVSCELYEDCEVLELMGEFESLDGCIEDQTSDFGPEGSACTEYQSAPTNECLEEILLMICDDLYTGVWPEACDEACN